LSAQRFPVCTERAPFKKSERVMISKTFATVLLVTSMMALATVAHGMGGGRGGGGNVPQPGTWNWPPYADGGNMPLHYDYRYHHCWWRHGYRHCW
jgi:hypothetical protein